MWIKILAIASDSPQDQNPPSKIFFIERPLLVSYLWIHLSKVFLFSSILGISLPWIVISAYFSTISFASFSYL